MSFWTCPHRGPSSCLSRVNVLLTSRVNVRLRAWSLQDRTTSRGQCRLRVAAESNETPDDSKALVWPAEPIVGLHDLLLTP